jgi:ABC-2 type transport system permease protein
MSARHAIVLVARREIRERLRSRTFLYTTVLLLVLVGASAAVPGLVEPEKTYRVAVTAPVPRGLEAALQHAAEPFDATVRLQAVGSADAGRVELDGDVDALLVLGDSRLVFRANVDTELAAIADSAVRAFRRHLPPEPELTAVTLDPAEAESSDAEILVAMVSSILLLISLSVYGQWVLVGVLEEKTNRVVELVLSAVRSRHLLAGKVVGIGLLGLAQLALVAGLAGVLLGAGIFDAPAALGGSVALVVPWFALGFALYAFAFGAAGALASRQQDAATAAQPLTIGLAASYMIGYVAVSADSAGTLAHVLTVFPLTAPMVLPARSALVGVPLWEHALAVVLVLGSIYALVRLAGRVYDRGLLHTGPRLGARAVWRLVRER